MTTSHQSSPFIPLCSHQSPPQLYFSFFPCHSSTQRVARVSRYPPSLGTVLGNGGSPQWTALQQWPCTSLSTGEWGSHERTLICVKRAHSPESLTPRARQTLYHLTSPPLPSLPWSCCNQFSIFVSSLTMKWFCLLGLRGPVSRFNHKHRNSRKGKSADLMSELSYWIVTILCCACMPFLYEIKRRLVLKNKNKKTSCHLSLQKRNWMKEIEFMGL